MSEQPRRLTVDEWLDRLPEPGATPLQHLRHTVAAFSDTSGDGWVTTATMGLYPDRHWTGLTWGDLRAILARLESAETDAAWCWEHQCEWLGPCESLHY